MRRDCRHWTDEEIAKLCELWRASVSTATIAKRLMRSKTAILQRVHRLRESSMPDLPHRHRAPEGGWVTRKGLPELRG